jgi:putative tryptophan/tyrosine transport system substrate-binding protein
LARRPTLTAPARADVSEVRIGPFRSNKETDEEKCGALPNLVDKESPIQGLLLNSDLAEGVDAFVAELKRLGYTDGQNLVLDWRLIDSARRNASLAAELVAAKPDMLIAAGTQQVEALKHAAGTTPIVFANTGDPIGQALVPNLAHPGGTVTGISNFILETAAKRLELLIEVKPGLRPVAILFNPTNSFNVAVVRETEQAASASAITLVPVSVRSPDELAAALQRAVKEGAEALIGGSDIMIAARTSAIVTFAEQHRLPTIFPTQAEMHQAGSMLYAATSAEIWRRAAELTSKILKSANPGDLPVEQPTKFYLVVNLKTARTLGLAVPQSLLARADEVIE